MGASTSAVEFAKQAFVSLLQRRFLGNADTGTLLPQSGPAPEANVSGEGRVMFPQTETALDAVVARCQPFSLSSAFVGATAVVSHENCEVLFRCQPQDTARLCAWLLQPFKWINEEVPLHSAVGLYM